MNCAHCLRYIPEDEATGTHYCFSCAFGTTYDQFKANRPEVTAVVTLDTLQAEREPEREATEQPAKQHTDHDATKE